MACDMTVYRINNGENKYRPFVPWITKNPNNLQFKKDQIESKLISVCRCACRNIQVIPGGLNAA